MLIRALCDYYEVLAQEGKVLPEGYSNVNIHYCISLTPDGRIDHIIDWQEIPLTVEKKGKGKAIAKPRTVMLPRRTQKTAIDGNVIEHRPLYLFGLHFDKGQLTPDDDKKKAKKSHEAFKDKNLSFIEGLDSPVVNAYRNFIRSWIPAAETENPFLKNIGPSYSLSGYAFCLSGRPDLLLHEDPQVKEKWRVTFRQAEETAENTHITQCGIAGIALPIARIHHKIKGVPGGMAVGNTLISYKNPSELSYGQEASYSSNISETAMKKYTEALNFLLSSQKHRTLLGDMTILHWAASAEEMYDELFSALAFDNGMDADEMDESLCQLVRDARSGKVSSARLQETAADISPNVDFYIVGLKPNSSRISVKFIYRKSFGEIFQNIVQHYADMKIRTDQMRSSPLRQIIEELIPPPQRKKEKSTDPALMAKLLEAVLYGRHYPENLLSGIIRRIRTDQDDEENHYIKMNDTRLGIIKASINRQARLNSQKEEIKLALDKENKNPAYLCGRLFAVLESIQSKSANYSLNRTIKDSYFASASAAPATVFPKLMRLSQYHLAKIGEPKYAHENIEEIIDLLGNEFPERLSLTDQGKFMIGYYQQRSYTDQQIQKAMEEKKNGNQ